MTRAPLYEDDEATAADLAAIRRMVLTGAAIWLLSVVLGAAAWNGWNVWSALGGVMMGGR